MIGYGKENYLQICDGNFENNSSEINIALYLYRILMILLNWVQTNCDHKERYCKTTKISYLVNFYDYCEVLQGNFYIFNEVDEQFFIYDKKLLLIKKLYRWFSFKYRSRMRSNDYLIKKYDEIIDLGIIIWFLMLLIFEKILDICLVFYFYILYWYDIMKIFY